MNFEIQRMQNSIAVLAIAGNLNSLASLLWARSIAGTIGGSIYLTHVSAMVNDVLQITKLSRLLKIEPTTRELLQDLSCIRKTPHSSRNRRQTASAVDYR